MVKVFKGKIYNLKLIHFNKNTCFEFFNTKRWRRCQHVVDVKKIQFDYEKN